MMSSADPSTDATRQMQARAAAQPRRADGGEMDRVRAGDPEAVDAWVRRHAPELMAVARCLLPIGQDPGDAVRETLVSGIRRIARRRDASETPVTLHRILLAECRRRGTRRNNPGAPIEDELPQFDASGAHAAPIRPWHLPAPGQGMPTATTLRVRACIDELPWSYRAVLVLSDLCAMPIERMARVVRLDAAAARTRLHRARMALRGRLDRALAER